MKKIRRLTALLLAIILAVGSTGAAQAAESYPMVDLTIRDILSDGTLVMNGVETDLTQMGIDLGDVVTVTFGGQSVDMAVVSEYNDVSTGRPFLALQGNRVLIGIYTGDFAETYGVAERTYTQQNAVFWNYLIEGGPRATFRVMLTRPGAYLREYHLRRLKYTKRRSDFPDLTDAEYANFRVVSTTGMGKNRLYRSASPVDPVHNRDIYAMPLLEERGITQALNLADTEKTMKAFKAYPGSWYAGMTVEALGLNMDYHGEAFRESLARGFRFLAKSPGATLIHCAEGKDRTGYVVGLLECLMGAKVSELIQDYMLSFQNYYGLTQEDDRYTTLARNGLLSQLAKAFGLSGPDDMYTADLMKEAQEFMLGLGLTQEEVDALRANLAKDRPFVDVRENTWMDDAAANALRLGLMSGVGNDRFDPRGLATRAQSVMALWNLAGRPAAEVRAPFLDVPENVYYHEALGWAFHHGIVTGRTETTFDPDAKVTRQEMATLLFRMKANDPTWGDSDVKWMDPSAWPEEPDSWLEIVVSPLDIEAILEPFADRGDIFGYARSPLSWAVSNGLIKGRSATQLAPLATATRVEMALLLARVLEKQH